MGGKARPKCQDDGGARRRRHDGCKPTFAAASENSDSRELPPESRREVWKFAAGVRCELAAKNNVGAEDQGLSSSTTNVSRIPKLAMHTTRMLDSLPLVRDLLVLHWAGVSHGGMQRQRQAGRGWASRSSTSHKACVRQSWDPSPK